MLGYVYFKDLDNHIPTTNGDVIKGSLSLGMIVGQIGFGILGDTVGRQKVYGYELMATMFGTLMCVLLPWNGLSHNSIVAWMSVWRVVTGLGIGGGEYDSLDETSCLTFPDYPMSSSLAAESTPLGSRAILVLSVFACIGVGAFTSSIVYLILLAAFQSSIEHDINNLEWVWRLLMGLGMSSSTF